MLKLRKLNTKGFTHDFMALFFVVIFAIVGVGYLVISHADTAYTSTNEFSKFQYGVSSGTTETITHDNTSNLTLQFNKGLTGYHPTDMAWYQLSLPANTTATSLTANVSYVDAGYDTVFVATGSPTNTPVWKVSNASTQSNQPISVSFTDKPTVIYFGISAKGSAGGFSGTFPGDRNLIVNSYTLNGTTTGGGPTVNISASPTSVNSGSSSNLTWSSTNATSCTASGAWSGAKATSGNQSVAVQSSTTYTLTCTGSGGSNTASTTVNVAAAGGGGGGGGGGTTANCTQTLSPGANLASAESSAPAGAVICLSPGTYSAVTFNSSHGTSAAPITITSKDTAHPALILGRTVTDGSASYLTLSHLKFQWVSGNSADTVVLGTPHENFVYNDVSGIDQTICLNGVSYGGSTVSYSLIDHNTIHNCGQVGKSGSNTAQGVYMLGGPGDVISNNWCWNAAARCYQVRGEQGGSWHNNVSDNSGQGWIFGDVGAANNNVYNNIVGSAVGNGSNGGYSVFEYNSKGSGNSFHNNCVSVATQLHTVATSNNTVVKVQFVDPANHNYNLTSASVNDACRSYAVQGGNPGP